MAQRKIAIFVRRLSVAGVERFVIDLANKVCDAHQVHLFILENAMYQTEQLLKPGIRVIEFQHPGGFNLSLFRLIRQKLKEFAIEVVFTNNYSTFLEGIAPATLQGVKARIHIQHGLEFNIHNDSRFHRLIRRVLQIGVGRLVTNAVAVSHAGLVFLNMEWKIPEKKIEVIHNGVDVEKFRPLPEFREEVRQELGIPSEAFVVGSVCRVEPVKNVAMMVEAVHLLRERIPELHLVVLGKFEHPEEPGSYTNQIKQMMEKYGLTERIHFLPPRLDVRPALNAMDIYLNTSLSEGLSIAIVEAMASGLPVIATDVGGNPEVVENGVNGFLVPSRNAQALAERIKYLHTYPEMLNILAKNSRERAVQHFSGETMRQKYLQLIDRVTQGD